MSSLEQRPFGRTGEQVTAISLGGVGLPRVSFADGVATCLSAFNYGAINRGIRRQLLPAASERGVAVLLGGVFRQGRLV